jgi:NAD(P)-dependent dehydrogenase (short-subunit alcohol dehydrogenase family)
MSSSWSSEQIPDQSGRIAIVTGANSGLGLSVARELAQHGAHVVMACRNLEKGQAALQEVERAAPSAELELVQLDLASLESVEAFANAYRSDHGGRGLDLLINNAGVMAPPRRETKDGFELQFGTNVLGHFALTGRLISLMEGHEDARVVTVSSNAHKFGRIKFDDLQSKHRYSRWMAYGQSKLGDLMLALELDRRLREASSTIKSMGAHPGYAATNLQSAAPPMVDQLLMRFTNLVMAQSADMGALSILYAATEPGLPGGSYAGPDGFAEQRGHPKLVRPSSAARDEVAAKRLWEECEALTSVHFDLGAPANA